MTQFAKIDTAAHEGAFGVNSRPEPTKAMLLSGNYKKGRVSLYDIPLVIENPRGTLRKWEAADGTSGANLMKFHYGYFEGVMGADGDELDCYVGPYPESDVVFVINQNMRGTFDEHKVMLGFPDRRTAEAGYLSNFNSGWQGLQSCVPCSVDELKWWMAEGDRSKPLTADQLPNGGRKDMEKVIWDNANQPRGATLGQVLYGIQSHDGQDGLVFDPVSVADILADAEGVLKLDALVVPFMKLTPRMAILKKVMDRAGGDLSVAALQVTDPFTQKGSTNVAAIFELSDGQTLSIFFHNPDVTPKKILATDELVSWKWLLNKKDVTIVVAPERGQDLNVRNVAARVMMLAKKNSARFVTANVKRAATMQEIASLESDFTTKTETLNELLAEISQLEVQVAAKPAAAPVFDPVPEPLDAPLLVPSAEPVLDPVTVLDPVLDPIVDPVIVPVLDPVVDLVLDPVPEPLLVQDPPIAPVPDPLPDVAIAAAPGAVDITYRASSDGMFTAFYPMTPAGEDAWKIIAADTDGTGKVLSQHADSVIAQLREKGYRVELAEDPDTIDTDALLASLTADVTAAPVDPVLDIPEPLEPLALIEPVPVPLVEPVAPDVPALIAPEPEPEAIASTLVANFINEADGTDVQVHVMLDGRFSVILRDTDADAVVGGARIYTDKDQAIANAKAISEGKVSPDATVSDPEVPPVAALVDPVPDPVIDLPAPIPDPEPPGTLDNPAFALLRAVIDGSTDLSSPTLFSDLKAANDANSGDPEFMDLFKAAANAYKAFALTKARAALAA